MSKTEIKRSIFKRFFAADEGATAVIFAFMLVPLLAMAGGAVDYSTAMRVKSELTATLDSAVLAATQAYALDENVDVAKIINDFVNQNYSQSGKVLFSSEVEVGNPVIDESGELSASLRVQIPTNFLSLVGYNSFDFTLGSSARVGGRSLEVALVLDNTGSMTGSKLTALKNSATTLVDQLMQVDGDNVRVALVPFADYVNIGMEHRSEAGLDIPDDYTITWTPNGNHCWDTYPNSTQHCEPVREMTTCYNDGEPYECERIVDWDCTGDPGEAVEYCEPWTEQSKSFQWFGCMGSRPHDLNVRDEDYATGVPGIIRRSWDNQCSGIAPMVRLTTDKSAVTSGIDAMNADRSTYIPSGLAWGWRAISDQTPFADGVAYDESGVTKVIVLMTDGDNTLSMKRWHGKRVEKHQGQVWGHDASTVGHPERKVEADGYTAELCQNIKDKGVVIHTIAFEVPAGSPVETLMRNCAGNGGQYFDADNSAELASAFKKIALALLNLRLSK